MTTAPAVARYLLADAARSQRVILALRGAGRRPRRVVRRRPRAVARPWGVSCLTAYPVAAWFALTVANTEDLVQRSVTVVAAGGPGPVAAGTLLAALVGDLLLTVLSVGWGAATTTARRSDDHRDRRTGPSGGDGHGDRARLAVRPSARARIGWSLLLGVIVVVVTTVQPWLPPVGAAVAVLVDGRGPAALAVPVVLAFVLAIRASVASAAAARRA